MGNTFKPYWNFKTLFWLLVLIRAYFNGMLPLMDQTEARYAEIARLMLETQNWVVLQIDYGIPFWAKPPLSTWAAALSMMLFGTHPFFVRLPYLLVHIGLALGIQKVISNEKIPPYLASLILFTIPEFYLHSGVVSTDVFLQLAVVLVMGSFWQMQNTLNYRLWGNLLFFGIGLGLLAKGPIIGILTLPPLFLWTLMQKQFGSVLKKVPWGTGIPIMLLVALPWYAAAEKASPGFLDYFIIGEHFSRFFDSTWTGDRYGFAKQQPLGIIWVFLMGVCLPWIFIAIRYLFKNRNTLKLNAKLLFLFLWLVWTPFFFTFSKSLIHPYTLPVMVPVALLVIESWPKVVFKKFYLSFAIGIPLLLFGLFVLGAGKEAIENSTDRYLVSQHSTDEPIFAYKRKSYSSQFYTQGNIKIIDSILLQEALESRNPFSLLIEKKWVHQIDTMSLQLIKENRKKRLYKFVPSE